MLPIRRLAAAQAPRLLRSQVVAPAIARSFHAAPFRSSPIPESTDEITKTSSTRTAGKGLNEAGGKNDNAPNAHNTSRSTSNSGRAASTPASDHKYGPGGSSADLVEPVKEKAKRATKKVKDTVKSMTENASDNVQYGTDKAKVGFDNVKAEVKHTVRKAKTSVKQAARDMENQSATSTAAYTTAPAGATGAGVDTEAVKAKARDAAQTAKETASNVLSSVKQAASSAMEGLKGATAGVTATAGQKLSEASNRMAETKENASTRLSNFGERMEAKFEKFGEDLLKSGDEIDRRNREAGEPLPEPLPLDEVDHMPNPKDPNDVLPGTGFKDQQKNTPITDRKGGGQFPG